jgi:hypothetical protein
LRKKPLRNDDHSRLSDGLFFRVTKQRNMPRQKKQKSEAKQSAITNNGAIQCWRDAAKELGYLQSGKFVAIPKQGTPEHSKIKERQAELMKARGVSLKAHSPEHKDLNGVSASGATELKAQ